MSAARRGRRPCASTASGRPLEVQVPVLIGFVQDLGQQQAAAIAQARVVRAELVAGVHHRPWVGLVPQLVAAEQFGEQRQFGLGRVEVQQRHGRLARHYQAGLGDGLGQHLGRNASPRRAKRLSKVSWSRAFTGCSWKSVPLGPLCGAQLWGWLAGDRGQALAGILGVHALWRPLTQVGCHRVWAAPSVSAAACRRLRPSGTPRPGVPRS